MSTAERVRGRSASELEALGKTAARLSDTSGLSLTEAAVRTLEPESLNAEQIRRVVEHANIAAVNTKFASLRGDRIVHIEGGPADPVSVIDALHASASAPGAQIQALEYSVGPSQRKVAHAVPYSPPPDVEAVEAKLAAAHSELVDMCAGIEFRMESKFAELCEYAKRASREGASLCDLAAAWSTVDPRLAKVAVHQLGGEIRWGEKTAGRSVSAEHPVMRAFRTFAKTAMELQRAATARQSVEAELARVSGFLESRVC
jgi:hypothetical protein